MKIGAPLITVDRSFLIVALSFMNFLGSLEKVLTYLLLTFSLTSSLSSFGTTMSFLLNHQASITQTHSEWRKVKDENALKGLIDEKPVFVGLVVNLGLEALLILAIV